MGAVTFGLIDQPVFGESQSGDAYCIREGDGFVLVAVADGLGHGKDAAEASAKAISYISDHLDKAPEALLRDCHAAIRGTRGAVVAIARIEPAKGTLVHVGLGNIETRIVAEEKVYRPVPVNGIVGHQMHKLRTETFPFNPGDLLIMHSDGISDRFDLGVMARERDPQMLANQIVQTHGRDHDDQLLLIVRLGS